MTLGRYLYPVNLTYFFKEKSKFLVLMFAKTESVRNLRKQKRGLTDFPLGKGWCGRETVCFIVVFPSP